MDEDSFEDEAYAAWSHQIDLETRQFRDEDDWLELQLTIYTQIQVQKDELKDCERGWW